MTMLIYDNDAAAPDDDGSNDAVTMTIVRMIMMGLWLRTLR